MSIFYRRTYYLHGAAEMVLPFFHMKKALAEKNSEVSWMLSGAIQLFEVESYVIVVAFTSLPLLVADSPLFFHHIDMHWGSF